MAFELGKSTFYCMQVLSIISCFMYAALKNAFPVVIKQKVIYIVIEKIFYNSYQPEDD